MQCDHPTSEEFYAGLADKIKNYGHTVLGVLDFPSFCYTIGMFEKIGFEFLMVGLDPQKAAVILNDICTDPELLSLKTDEPIDRSMGELPFETDGNYPV